MEILSRKYFVVSGLKILLAVEAAIEQNRRAGGVLQMLPEEDIQRLVLCIVDKIAEDALGGTE